MAKRIEAKERVTTENVILVRDDLAEPKTIIRRNSENGGRVEMFKVERMGFDDTKAFLQTIAEGAVATNDKEAIDTLTGKHA